MILRCGPDASRAAGVGTVTFLATEIFKEQAGIKLTEIPYQGGGESLRAVVAGEVQVYFSPLAVALPFIQDGKLRALAMTSKERMSLLPDVPTVAESGYPDYSFNLWNGIVVPAGTPPEIIEKIRATVVEAAKFTPGLWLLNRIASVYLDVVTTIRFAVQAPPDYVAVHSKFFDLLEAGESSAAVFSVTPMPANWSASRSKALANALASARLRPAMS